MAASPRTGAAGPPRWNVAAELRRRGEVVRPLGCLWVRRACDVRRFRAEWDAVRVFLPRRAGDRPEWRRPRARRVSAARRSRAGRPERNAAGPPRWRPWARPAHAARQPGWDAGGLPPGCPQARRACAARCSRAARPERGAAWALRRRGAIGPPQGHLRARASVRTGAAGLPRRNEAGELPPRDAPVRLERWHPWVRPAHAARQPGWNAVLASPQKGAVALPPGCLLVRCRVQEVRNAVRESPPRSAAVRPPGRLWVRRAWRPRRRAAVVLPQESLRVRQEWDAARSSPRRDATSALRPRGAAGRPKLRACAARRLRAERQGRDAARVSPRAGAAGPPRGRPWLRCSASGTRRPRCRMCCLAQGARRPGRNAVRAPPRRGASRCSQRRLPWTRRPGPRVRAARRSRVRGAGRGARHRRRGHPERGRPWARRCRLRQAVRTRPQRDGLAREPRRKARQACAARRSRWGRRPGQGMRTGVARPPRRHPRMRRSVRRPRPLPQCDVLVRRPQWARSRPAAPRRCSRRWRPPARRQGPRTSPPAMRARRLCRPRSPCRRERSPRPGRRPRSRSATRVRRPSAAPRPRPVPRAPARRASHRPRAQRSPWRWRSPARPPLSIRRRSNFPARSRRPSPRRSPKAAAS